MTFGVPQQSWLESYPMAAVIVANVWRGTAFSMLLYASALEGIAPELFEAAGIDGAGMWKKLRYITLPMIKGAITTDLLLITLATLSDFTLVFVLTGGGPGYHDATADDLYLSTSIQILCSGIWNGHLAVDSGARRSALADLSPRVAR